MSFYEVVVSRKSGCSYIACDSLKDAKEVMAETAKREALPFRLIFVRQYRKRQVGDQTYRVLHRLTIRGEEIGISYGN